jgi:hypothetical protein
MIIAIDFDGTLHTGTFPEIGEPKPGAVQAMQKLKLDGHRLILWTCRCGERLTNTINWLLNNQMPFDLVNENTASSVTHFGSNSRKINADLYVDDKQVGGLPEWDDIYKYVRDIEKECKYIELQAI